MIYDYETPEFLQQILDRLEIYKKLKELDIEPYNKMEDL